MQLRTAYRRFFSFEKKSININRYPPRPPLIPEHASEHRTLNVPSSFLLEHGTLNVLLFFHAFYHDRATLSRTCFRTWIIKLFSFYSF